MMLSVCAASLSCAQCHEAEGRLANIVTEETDADTSVPHQHREEADSLIY